MISNARTNKRWLSLIPVVASILMAFAGPGASFGQQDIDLFDTSSLEKRLVWQFNLTRHDVKLLHPLIRHESEKVLLVFGRCSQDKSDDFISLWDKFRIDHMQFELGLANDLSNRQKSALRAARIEFEMKTLNVWLDDYIGMLTDLLELDSFKLTCLLRVFENETSKRYKHILAEARTRRPMDKQWQDITDERERYIRLILDDDQLHSYLSLGKPADMLIAKADTRPARFLIDPNTN